MKSAAAAPIKMQQKQESQESVSDMNEVFASFGVEVRIIQYNDNLGVNFSPQGIKGSQYSAGSELPSFILTFPRYTSSWGTYRKITFVVRGYQVFSRKPLVSQNLTHITTAEHYFCSNTDSHTAVPEPKTLSTCQRCQQMYPIQHLGLTNIKSFYILTGKLLHCMKTKY